MGYLGKVLVHIPGETDPQEPPVLLVGEYDTYQEAKDFVTYWKTLPGISFYEGDVVEYD